MNYGEPRTGARFISDFRVVLRPARGGVPLDESAIAHNVSMKGFKIETQSQLSEKIVVSFQIELPSGSRAGGKGRIARCSQDSFATWAELEIISMSWVDKWHLSQALHPGRVDWARLSELSIKFAVVVLVVVMAHHILIDDLLRKLLLELAPKLVALIVMGWSLAGLLKSEQR